jgi:hypothetical protein
MKKYIILFIFFPSILLLIDCKKDEINTTPYNPHNHAITVTAKINNYNFIAYDITVAGAINEPSKFIGIISQDLLYYTDIRFPKNCGEKSFDLPNSDPNVYLGLNNVDCKTGKLVITNYDVNLVEGYFEFRIDKDSLINVTEGKFSIVYRID